MSSWEKLTIYIDESDHWHGSNGIGYSRDD